MEDMCGKDFLLLDEEETNGQNVALSNEEDSSGQYSLSINMDGSYWQFPDIGDVNGPNWQLNDMEDTSGVSWDFFDNILAAHSTAENVDQVAHATGQIARNNIFHTSQNTLYPNERHHVASSINPPAQGRKPKAPTLGVSHWEPYKTRIIELYTKEKRPLEEVRLVIQQEQGFTADIRQYRLRLTQWKLDKNIKYDEMKCIVRKRQRRKLVEVDKGDLTFWVRGQEVDPQKVERWMKRHRVMESMRYSPDPASSSPSAVSCRTISERGSPVPQGDFDPPVSPDLVLIMHHIFWEVEHMVSVIDTLSLSIDALVSRANDQLAGCETMALLLDTVKEEVFWFRSLIRSEIRDVAILFE